MKLNFIHLQKVLQFFTPICVSFYFELFLGVTSLVEEEIMTPIAKSYIEDNKVIRKVIAKTPVCILKEKSEH